ncbi:dihydrodipicolinate synthase family protein [Dyadobacter chenwenxiniae]|uniref:Dihydrodipicolinate synthase family protein n=1 Tax=Dyadobacter chenwenxiniae TaxID=2906456 RepID=A0A9X1PMY4_9BACT|nr:dihydrodipicolinate synthase family protein [Dyadobacter chenwenxiniae]MCF0063410.1 dihydrodipicolinate synthase family protein [Dyadobacter chenwenxiniae]UON85211.1 dihydrodipicolinate synthase family protein [Dyadobacter chenwenxiniae]
MLNQNTKKLLFDGTVIPAHPLALQHNLQLDERRQRGLTRYYMASGAGGVAIGVHTTQFEIRDPEVNLYEAVLRITAEEIDQAGLDRPFIKVAGICGLTDQAVKEAHMAVKYGYDLGLVSMAAFKNQSEADIIKHIKTIAEIIPVFGFYLQAAIGGRIYSYNFWQQFAEIPNVLAIKIAAFNRYQTLDVVRAVCNSSRVNDIALYTGNDDNIVADLITPYRFEVNGEIVEKTFVGGLLGHWAVWTEKAVKVLADAKEFVNNKHADAADILRLNVAVTDMNAAIFDPAHNFHGCITGVHEVLVRQGLMEGIRTLNPKETLSPGQAEEITRVMQAYPHLIDDEFVNAFLAQEIRAV